MQSQTIDRFPKFVAGHKLRLIPEPVWLNCPGDEFIDCWLPLFESGQLRPEEAPVIIDMEFDGNPDATIPTHNKESPRLHRYHASCHAAIAALRN